MGYIDRCNSSLTDHALGVRMSWGRMASIVIYECPNFTYRRVFRILFATAATTTRATIIIQYSMWMPKTSNPWMSICKIASSGRQPENILFFILLAETASVGGTVRITPSVS
jgi:hypothetical protein